MICKKLIDYNWEYKRYKNKEEYKETPINNYLCQKAGVKTTSKVKISSLPKIIAKDKILLQLHLVNCSLLQLHLISKLLRQPQQQRMQSEKSRLIIALRLEAP